MKKKIILYLAFVMAIIFQFNIDIFADTPDMEIGDEDFYYSYESSEVSAYFPSTFNIDTIDDSVIDSSGHYIRGSIVMYSNQFNVNWIYGNQFDTPEFSKPCEYMFVIVDRRDTTSIKYYLAWSDRQDNDYQKMLGYCSYGSADPYNRWRGYWLGQSNISSGDNFICLTSQYGSSPNVFVKTNLPIFDISNVSAIENYINNGSIAGADNKNDLQPSPVVPQPFFANGQGLDQASRYQELTPSFTDSMKYVWSPGSNENYTWENMGYECYLNVNVVYKNTLGNSISSTYRSATYRYSYPASNPFITFTREILNAGLANYLGDGPFELFCNNGYIVSADFMIRNYDKSDSSNYSAWVYGKYNFLNKNWSTNNNTNDNNDTTEESTEDITTNPNQTQTGDNNSNSSSSASAGSSSSSANVTNNNNPTNNNDPTFTNNNDPSFTNDPTFTNSPTYNGNTVSNNPTYEGNSVTNNPTYNGNTVTISNSKGFWDLIASILDSDREDKQSIIDGIVDTVKAIPTLLDTLTTFIGGEEDQDGHPTGGINGFLESLQATAVSFSTAYTTLISGITSVVSSIGNFATTITSSINDLFDNLFGSINGVLSAGSTFGQYITSGFGLLGDNGYIALLSGYMDFIPDEIWSIITLAVSSSASLLLSGSVVKFLKR